MRIVVIVLVVAFFTVGAHKVFAHNADMSFVQVNFKPVKAYPVEKASVSEITVPHDVGEVAYYVNYRVTFLVDVYKLYLPEEEVPYTKFYWDFGDGNGEVVAESHKHVYTKPGTYYVKLYKQAYALNRVLLHTLFVHVLPDVTYEMPGVSIWVNNKEHKIVSGKIIAAKRDNEVLLQAKQSSGSGTIASYQWDFGDGTSATGERVKHRYNPNQDRVPVLVRATDANGIIVDTPFVLALQRTSFTTIRLLQGVLALSGLIGIGLIALRFYMVGRKQR